MSCGIYAIHFLDKIIYVGQSKNIERRMSQHMSNKTDDYPMIDGFLTQYQSYYSDPLDCNEDGALFYSVLEYCDADRLNEEEDLHIRSLLGDLLNHENPNRRELYENLLDELEDMAVEDELWEARINEAHFPCQNWLAFRKPENEKKVKEFRNQCGWTEVK
jgi:hypothetical protein